MIDISGHLRNIKKEKGFEDLSYELVVNCCGYQSFDTVDFSRSRPNGRLDFQIIYIYKGTGEYYLNNEFVKVGAGNVILYYPDYPQVYNYYADEKPEVYWIHFTGSRANSFLKQFDFNKTGVHYIGKQESLVSLFRNTIYELQLKQKNYKYITYANLFNIVSLISRISTNSSSEHLNTQRNYIQNVIEYIHTNYSKKLTVEQLAQMANLSRYRFIHVFKEHTGLPPIEYLTLVRIDKAKELMQESSLNVQQISDIIGYSSPLYFSRIFKKNVGMSPLEYKKS